MLKAKKKLKICLKIAKKKEMKLKIKGKHRNICSVNTLIPVRRLIAKKHPKLVQISRMSLLKLRSKVEITQNTIYEDL